jgi:hypothetical protein
MSVGIERRSPAAVAEMTPDCLVGIDVRDQFSLETQLPVVHLT